MKRGTTAGLYLWGGAAVLAALAGLAVLAWGDGTSGRYLAGGLLLAAALFCGVAVRVLRREVRSLEDLRQLLSGAGDPETFRRQAATLSGLPGAVAQAAADRMEDLQEQLEETRKTAGLQAEQRFRRDMTEELCRSTLPQVLRESPATAAFALAGLVETAETSSCTFYDYFFIDPGLLCVMVGQVPGGGISEALYLVVAQTTIRSRLRMGRSLVETMADVNMQLYDQGAQQSLCALVATLNTANGTFTYVNAGGELPLLMRNGERYEWLEAPVYAALGMNENVSYRAQSLRLRQGDHLLLQTAGLGEICNGSGVPFRDQELRAVLNRSRSKAQTPEEILRFTADEAAAWCRRDADRIGYAALMLEYRKGDKELAHCIVPAMPAAAGEVMEFLKKRFEDNGIQRRHYARVAVLVDEMFALCCRCCGSGDTVMVECGIAPDGQSATIRMSAPLGGRNPMERADDAVTAASADFIRGQVDYLTFKAREEGDTLTAVCFLEGELPAQES